MLRGNPSSWMVDAIISQPYLDVDAEKGWKGLLEHQSWPHPLLPGAGQDALCTPFLHISYQIPHMVACRHTHGCHLPQQGNVWAAEASNPSHTVKAAGAAPAAHKPIGWVAITGQIHVNFCQIPLNLKQLLTWAKAAMRWGTQSKLD